MKVPRDRQVILPSSSPRAIEWAADEIRNGRVVAIPTDTVYGLAASVLNASAVRQLYTIKGRPAERTIPILVSSVAAFERLAGKLDSPLLSLVAEFWPGGLTIVVPAIIDLPQEVVAPDGTVGVRLPNHPLAIEVIERSGGAIACTSANPSDQPAATTADQVANYLGADLELVLDGGLSPGGQASTVVQPTDGSIEILRPGPISQEELERVWDISMEKL